MENAIKIFNNAIIIGIGCQYITIQEMIEKIKDNDTKLEWTYGYSDDLYSIANETITNSKELYKKSLNSNISYFDASIDGYKTYEKVINTIGIKPQNIIFFDDNKKKCTRHIKKWY